MCGAYSQTRRGVDMFISKMIAEKVFKSDWPDRYNLRPTQQSAVIFNDEKLKCDIMRFGLIPSWSKTDKMEFPTFNARSETVDKLPTYRGPFKFRRAVVPIDGFYEFLKSDKERIPYYFSMKNGDPFLVAAVFDVNDRATDKEIKSFSIITAPANDVVSAIHPRMPVILTLEEAHHWLNPDLVEPDPLKALLDPYPKAEMQSWMVSRDVNSNRNEGSDLIKPVQ